MDKKIRITPLKTQIKSVIIFIAAIVLFLVCINLLDLDIEKFLKRLKNAGNILSRLVTFDISKMPDEDKLNRLFDLRYEKDLRLEDLLLILECVRINPRFIEANPQLFGISE